METFEENFGQLDTNPAWTRVDVVFDAIFKYLTVAQLKQIRLVNKSFSVAAAKFLSRKTVIRLTGIVKPVADKVPVFTSDCSLDSSFFECPCELEAPQKEYISIDSYTEYLESAAFNSNFIPKCISVVSSSDIWLLPLPHFSLLEDLHVLTFRPSEVLRILDELPSLFPNLKSLEFQYIQPDLEANGEPQQQVVSESTSVAKKRKKSQDLLLEKLAITVSSYWPFQDLEFFDKLPKLKALTLRWSGEYPTDCEDRYNWIVNGVRTVFYPRFDLKSDMFGKWLQGAALAPNFRFLTDLNLRLDLTPTNTKSTQNVLNSLNLERLSLELYGIGEELKKFVLGLHRSTLLALRNMLWTSICWFWLGPSLLLQALAWMGENGFFEKSEWTLTFREICEECGDRLFFLVRTENQLVEHNGGLYSADVLSEVISKYLSVNFNYTFRRVLYNDGYSYNDLELFEPQDLFQSRLIAPHNQCEIVSWCYDEDKPIPMSKRMYRSCSCHRCSPRQTILPCDMFTLFPEEIGIVWPPHEHHRKMDEDMVSFTRVFCYVHRETFEKWMTILNPPYSSHPGNGY